MTANDRTERTEGTKGLRILRSHLMNRGRWRGLRFGLAARSEEGASWLLAATAEQRSGQTEDLATPSAFVHQRNSDN